MKKITAIIVLTLTLFLMSGCGGEDAAQTQENTEEVTETNSESTAKSETQLKLEEDILKQKPAQIEVNENLRPGYTVEELNTLGAEYKKLEEIMNKEPDINNCDELKDANLNKMCREWASLQNF
jgi:ABC-type glycerol-3-phosphate transport system substrate-binding protein